MARYEITNLPQPVDFECSSDMVRRTLQNAKNLLMCHMGEVPYDRYRGFDAALYDLPLPQLRERLVKELDRVMMWEPDVEVVSATAEMNADHGVEIRCVVEITFEE